MKKCILVAILAFIISAAASAGVGPAWAWEAGKITNNGSVQIKSTSGTTTYNAVQNPVGDVAKVNQSALTQPPTLIMSSSISPTKFVGTLYIDFPTSGPTDLGCAYVFPTNIDVPFVDSFVWTSTISRVKITVDQQPITPPTTKNACLQPQAVVPSYVAALLDINGQPVSNGSASITFYAGTGDISQESLFCAKTTITTDKPMTLDTDNVRLFINLGSATSTDGLGTSLTTNPSSRLYLHRMPGATCTKTLEQRCCVAPNTYNYWRTVKFVTTGAKAVVGYTLGIY